MSRHLLLLLLLIPLQAGAQPLQRGEVLVAQGERILRVDPDSGATALFSPLPGTPSLIDQNSTDNIVIDSTAVFRTSHGILISIDPVTGEQHQVKARNQVCQNNFCFFQESPLDIGSGAEGLALGNNANLISARSLYVAAIGGALFRVDRSLGAVNSTLVANTGLGAPFQLEFEEVFVPAGYLLYFGFASAVYRWDSFDQMVVLRFDEGFLGGLQAIHGDLFSTRTGGADDPGAASVSVGNAAPTPIATGGFLRNPRGLAVDPDDETRIFVAENGADKNGHKLLRLDFDGVAWVQTKLAVFDDSYILRAVAVSPVTFVPEPQSLTLGLAAFAAFAAFAVLARRARRAPRRA